MASRFKYFPLALAGLLFASCSKKSGSANEFDARGGMVLVAGNDGANPVLWQNGTALTLSTSGGTASQILASNNDIYIAGVTGESQSFNSPGGPSGQYVYWKNNNTAINISSPAFIRSGSSIAIAGNDVYYANSRLYKNNVLMNLPGQGSGYISAIFAVGNDFYCAGSDSVGNAVCWKNSNPQIVVKSGYPTLSGGDPSVFCMYVSGNDVYIGGLDANNTATYWKNGTAINILANGHVITGVRAIFVQGSDVYVAGNFLTQAGLTQPAYFKNGVEYDLPLDGASSGSATAIFVQSSDVYVSGQTTTGAVYWKNGVETVLSPKGSANSILVF
jgi:hypothetical protein